MIKITIMEENNFYSFKNQRKHNIDNKNKYNNKKHSNKNYHNNNNNNHSDNPKSNALINVYLDTKKYFEDKVTEKSTLYDISLLQIEKVLQLKPKYDCKIIIKNQDSLDMALDFIQEGYSKPLVLNMASNFKSGGGTESGKTAQEECLFRRTDAFKSYNNEWYPLDKNDAIYSPKLQIIKDSNYDMLSKDIIDKAFISMIGLAAIRKPHLINNKYQEDDEIIMMNKIESIFKIAILNGNDCCVLGSLGCGVFKNPPEQVAEMFKKAMNIYKDYFKVIGFAILCVKESDKENITEFRRILDN